MLMSWQSCQGNPDCNVEDAVLRFCDGFSKLLAVRSSSTLPDAAVCSSFGLRSGTAGHSATKLAAAVPHRPASTAVSPACLAESNAPQKALPQPVTSMMLRLDTTGMLQKLPEAASAMTAPARHATCDHSNAVSQEHEKQITRKLFSAPFGFLRTMLATTNGYELSASVQQVLGELCSLGDHGIPANAIRWFQSVTARDAPEAQSASSALDR